MITARMENGRNEVVSCIQTNFSEYGRILASTDEFFLFICIFGKVFVSLQRI